MKRGLRKAALPQMKLTFAGEQSIPRRTRARSSIRLFVKLVWWVTKMSRIKSG